MRPLTAMLAAIIAAAASPAAAFCGFYVAKADADLFNDASKVVYVRDGDRSVITMASDYAGEPAEFAMVVPTPTVLTRRQINVTENALVDHLDAYTAPRLVEYFDDDPCRPVEILQRMTTAAPMGEGGRPAGDDALGVTVEANYTVGEYDIQILSATQSDGLETWLTAAGYRMPEGAAAALAPYIRDGMKFFVARVNLAEHDRIGGGFLRPLQIAFESPEFMLPIRLGMVNARGPQDLLLYTLTRGGRVETTNYRTSRLPTDLEVPLFVEEEFAEVYRAMFSTAIAREGGAGVIMEYAWDMAWCDPCAADPLSREQLIELGAFWLVTNDGGAPARRRIVPLPGPAQDVFVTRLHARYDEASFPEDLRLRVTKDRANFQGRFIMRHPWRGAPVCEAGEQYYAALPARYEREARTLANATRWPIEEIRAKMSRAGQDPGAPPPAPTPWWEQIWPEENR